MAPVDTAEETYTQEDHQVSLVISKSRFPRGANSQTGGLHL